MAKDKKPDVILNAAVAGIDAIQNGDVEGGAAALRFAQDMQAAQEARAERQAREKKQ
jgi:hypothetical protein